MATAVRMTADELMAMPDDGYQYQLIDGELVRMSPSWPGHSAIGASFVTALSNHVAQEDLGVVFGADAGFLLGQNPDTVLSPDVAYIQHDHLPADPDQQGYWPVAPDLVVEVASPSDRRSAISEKVVRYQQVGVRLVVVVWPQTRSLTVYALGHEPVELKEDATFDGGEVLPGMQLLVADLFRRRGRTSGT